MSEDNDIGAKDFKFGVAGMLLIAAAAILMAVIS